jgi:hypothetical protein
MKLVLADAFLITKVLLGSDVAAKGAAPLRTSDASLSSRRPW